jgi:hypothetical protein
MTGWIAAAEALGDIIAAENDALAALDLTAAAGFLARKGAGVDALAAAEPPEDTSAVRALAARLATLATRNQALLEHGIATQSRIIGLIADAARTTPARGYGKDGGQNAPAQPWTLSARI